MNKNIFKDLFELDEDITYLNCASMSPLLKSAKEAGIKSIEKRSKPWTLTDVDWFGDAEILRGKVSQVFQTSADNIAVIPAASYGLALAAKNIGRTIISSPKKSNGNIILIDDQFPSNYYVWDNLSKQFDLKINIIIKQHNKELTDLLIESINTDTVIVAIPNCHWIDGSLIDLERVSTAVKSVNAYLVLDLSQSLGALPININKIDPDFAVATGYKWMLGSYSLGYMYIAPRWQDIGEPLEYNWAARKGSEVFAALTNYTTEFKTGGRKFDMGEYAQFNSVPLAIAAVDQILKWGVENIQSNIKILTDIINNSIYSGGNFKLPVTPKASHIASVPLLNRNVDLIKQRLIDKKIYVSFRGDTIRVSPHLYNDTSDINNFLECLI